MTAKKSAVKTPGTALVNYKEELRKELESLQKRVGAPTGDYIRTTQDKKFLLPDGAKSDGPLSVVVIDFCSGNFFYDRPFKKGEESPPACFSLGLEPSGLKPSEKSPHQQAETCDECPNNQWGSNGAGKACSNQRILAVTAPGEEDKLYLLKISPTGIKAWDSYVQTIKNQFELPPIGVVTEIYFDPNLTYGSLRFGNPRPNPDIEKHFGMRAAARARLLTEPDTSSYTPPTPLKGKKR